MIGYSGDNAILAVIARSALLFDRSSHIVLVTDNRVGGVSGDGKDKFEEIHDDCY